MVSKAVCVTILFICELTSLGCHTKPRAENLNHSTAGISEGTHSEPELVEPVMGASFFGSSYAWVYTGDGNICRTTDEGGTWEKVDVSTIVAHSPASTSKCFLDNNRGWILNRKGEVWHSRDGARTWSLISESPVPGPIDQVRFVDDLHGWIAGMFSVGLTTDGGKTWKQHESNSPLKAAYFFDADTAMVLSGKSEPGERNGGRIYRTSDGGASWQEGDSNLSLGDIDSLFFVDENSGWLSGRPPGAIYKTDDQGKTWVPEPLPGKNTIISSTYFLDASEGWAAGSEDAPPGSSKEFSALLLHTVDGGSTWQLVPISGNHLGCEQVYFADRQSGWLLADSSIYRTSDAGQTWRIVLKADNQGKTE